MQREKMAVTQFHASDLRIRTASESSNLIPEPKGER